MPRRRSGIDAALEFVYHFNGLGVKGTAKALEEYFLHFGDQSVNQNFPRINGRKAQCMLKYLEVDR